MGAFEYTALDTRGRQKKGVLQGDTARQVRSQLRDQGLTPMAVSAVTDESVGGPVLRRRGTSISASERALIIRQMAGLAAAGLPLAEVLETLSEQSERPRTRRIMMALRSRVMEGRSLSSAMSEFPRAFPELYCATVAAGEQSGRLEAVLAGLADYAEKRQEVSRGTLLALLYPGLLGLVAIAIVTGLLTYVVPQVSTVFASFDRELPLLTRALLAVSDTLRTHGHWILLGIALVVGSSIVIMRQPGSRRVVHRMALRVPIVGGLTRASETARLVRTLSILVASAVPLLDALRIAARVLHNEVLREAVLTAATRVREGSTLARALGQEKRFPPLVTRLIAGGEKSGQLDTVLASAADIQEKELDTATRVFTGLLEPLLILFVGAMVLLIVLAILLPIFELNRLVQ